MRTRIAVLLFVLTLGLSLGVQGQNVSSANLRGNVTTASGEPVADAKITLLDASHNFGRDVKSGKDGGYRFSALPPGTYALRVDAEGFQPLEISSLVFTVGQDAVMPLVLQSSGEAVVQVVISTNSANHLETQRTSSTNTVTSERIDNLPINGRNYVQFALIDSQVKRDGEAPYPIATTSGLNFDGARARSNLVNVDGFDTEDSITKGIRSTVSQEAVGEFQVITNSFSPEYSHSTGGVVNIVTRGGNNEFHGDVYAFLRYKDFQAVNPFSTVSNPAYTRVQPGFTLGGPLRKDRTYFFLSYETTRRQETGFSTIGSNKFNLVSIDASRYLGAGATVLGTAEQKVFLENSATPVNPQTVQYAQWVGAGSSTALNGAPGSSTFASSGATLPLGFVPLQNLIGNYPVKEGTSLWGLRLDHKLTDMQQLFLRVNVSPSLVTGLESSLDGQVPGQGSYSRTDQQQYRDLSVAASHMWLYSVSLFNEARFQFARRGLGFDAAQAPGSQGVGVDIPGYAYFGRDTLAYLHRVEKRYQFADTATWTAGNHTVKFGGDFSYIPLNIQSTSQFGGQFLFGSENLFAGMPSLSPLQAYGLGLPQSFVQGVGDPNTSFSTKNVGPFAQDSWKIKSNLTVNYGVRYDLQLTPQFSASTPLAAAAQKALGVMQGIPSDYKDIAPRIGLAWDPWKDGKTVVRASYGIFYDHSPLTIAYQSGVYDGSRTPVIQMFGGTACTASTPYGYDPTLLNATNVFQGTLTNPNCLPLPGYLPDQQKFDPYNSSILAVITNQGYLTPANGFQLMEQPSGYMTAANFPSPYSQQADLQVERDLGGGFVLNLAYDYNAGHHLYQLQNYNPQNLTALVANWERAVAAGALSPSSSPNDVSSCGSGPAGAYYPAPLLSFFRVSGLNPSLSTLYSASCVAAAVAAFPGNSTTIPFADVNTQVSNGSSTYHALTAVLKKRAGKHLEFQAWYTWSHAIDNATDFISAPQNSFNLGADRASSDFDQRHRFVLSGVYSSGRHSGDGLLSHLASGWIVAPLIEISSGRPFNLLTGSTAQRPNVAASASTTDACGNTATASKYSPTGYLIPVCMNDGVYDGNVTVPLYGTLGRNTGITPMTVFTDMRIGRNFQLGERFHLEADADMFNIINKYNVLAVNTLFTQAGTPTATYDPRQLQLGLKVSW